LLGSVSHFGNAVLHFTSYIEQGYKTTPHRPQRMATALLYTQLEIQDTYRTSRKQLSLPASRTPSKHQQSTLKSTTAIINTVATNTPPANPVAKQKCYAPPQPARPASSRPRIPCTAGPCRPARTRSRRLTGPCRTRLSRGSKREVCFSLSSLLFLS
jgi:hypothetical protein